VTRNCQSCGRAFETDRHWHRYCWDCYWEQRDRGSWADDDGPSAGWREPPPGWEQKAEPPLAPRLDVRFLRDAIQLCHPDRHPPERFKTANTITATLIALLKEQQET
jgi:hypothetical protein